MLPYGERMAIKPFDGLRTGVGVQGVTGDKLLAESPLSLGQSPGSLRPRIKETRGGDASNGWPRSGCSTKARKRPFGCAQGRRELEPAKRL